MENIDKEKKIKIISIAGTLLLVLIIGISFFSWFINRPENSKPEETKKPSNMLSGDINETKKEYEDNQYAPISNYEYILTGYNGHKVTYFTPNKPEINNTTINASALKFKTKNNKSVYLLASAGFDDNNMYDMTEKNIQEHTKNSRDAINEFNIEFNELKWNDKFEKVTLDEFKLEKSLAYKTSGTLNSSDGEYKYVIYDLTANYPVYDMNLAIEFLLFSNEVSDSELDATLKEIIKTVSIK